MLEHQADYFSDLQEAPGDTPFQKATKLKDYVEDRIENCFVERKKGSKELLKVEVRAARIVRAHWRLLDDYDWHRGSWRREEAYLKTLTEQTPPGELVLWSDWKAYGELPLGKVTTTKMEFATARKQISIFGSILRPI